MISENVYMKNEWNIRNYTNLCNQIFANLNLVKMTSSSSLQFLHFNCEKDVETLGINLKSTPIAKFFRLL